MFIKESYLSEEEHPYLQPIKLKETYTHPSKEFEIFQTSTVTGEPGKQTSVFKIKTDEISLSQEISKFDEQSAGLFAKGLEYVPETAAWIIAPGIMAGTTVLAEGEKLTTLDADT